MKRWYWWAVGGVVAAGVVVALVILILPKSPVPPKIQQQLTSTLLLPHSRELSLPRQTVKYDSQLKLLSFTVKYQNQSVVVSEQPSPDIFADVPQAYEKMTDSMSDYGDFDTGVGTVHLTTPPQLHGKQAAIVNTKGTLLFAKPSGTLSEDNWRKFFNSFTAGP